MKIKYIQQHELNIFKVPFLPFNSPMYFRRAYYKHTKSCDSRKAISKIRYNISRETWIDRNNSRDGIKKEFPIPFISWDNSFHRSFKI